MPQPNSKESKQPSPTVEFCSEPVLVAAVLARLMARTDRPVHVGSSDVAKALDVLRKHPGAVRRDKSKALITFEVKISDGRKITVSLHPASLDAVSYFSGKVGLLAPLIAKACACANGQEFAKKCKALVGDVEVGPLPPGKSMRLTIAGKTVKLC